MFKGSFCKNVACFSWVWADMRAMQYGSSMVTLLGICGSCIARQVVSLFCMAVYSVVAVWRHVMALVASGGWGV